jgi:tetratricopeptide (TPR) repeat protein
MSIRQFLSMALIGAVTFFVISCGGNKEETMDTTNPRIAELQVLVDEYAPVKVEADINHLTERERLLVAKLAEAAKVCDDIFWLQSSHDALAIRDSLAKMNDDESNLLLKLVSIYYGPYDKMNEYKRFVGTGPDRRPDGGGFYPEDMTKEEFENHIKNNPQDKDAFEDLYTVIVRDENKKLKSVSYYEYYKDLEKLAKLLDEAVELCDNTSLKTYLQLRARAFRINNYFESDWAWMDLKDNNIDVIIGPIESYEDGIFNYKTSFEAVVFVKDINATKELDMYKESISKFQENLPWDKKYFVSAQADGTVLQIGNVVAYTGYCNKASKTIAAALPNDPAVYEKKGGKKSMYKNIMEAKFDKILKPIADIMIAPDMAKYVSKHQMMSFVTLHEISHNLGRGYVYKQPKLTVKAALKEKYSPLEECKADICAVVNQKVLFDLGKITKDDMRDAMVTYVAGLFRSMRFGAESAHGIANFIQFRYLLEKGGIEKTADGYFTFNEEKFFQAATMLAKEVLELQSNGDYKRASALVENYGKATPEIMKEFERVKSVPRDLNATYMY